jgi:preprotein translocase subunit YajC
MALFETTPINLAEGTRFFVAIFLAFFFFFFTRQQREDQGWEQR